MTNYRRGRRSSNPQDLVCEVKLTIAERMWLATRRKSLDPAWVAVDDPRGHCQASVGTARHVADHRRQAHTLVASIAMA